MKRERRFLDFSDFIPERDYDLQCGEEEMRRDLESVEKWLYLGADCLDNSFAKVGMTMGDLTSRSYSSSRPSYFLFCAFKCRDKISFADIKRIEWGVLSIIDGKHRNSDGSSKRMRHFESGALSECFSPIDFDSFFKDVHDAIYDNFRNDFVVSGLVNEYDQDVGDFIDCIFNKKLGRDHQKYKRMILRHD